MSCPGNSRAGGNAPVEAVGFYRVSVGRWGRRRGTFRINADLGLAGAFHLSTVADAGHARLTLKGLPEGVIAGWLDAEGIEDGVPFLISPDGHYDIDLNAYFLLHPAPENTQAAIAYDLASFLTFLWRNRTTARKTFVAQRNSRGSGCLPPMAANR